MRFNELLKINFKKILPAKIKQKHENEKLICYFAKVYRKF